MYSPGCLPGSCSRNCSRSIEHQHPLFTSLPLKAPDNPGATARCGGASVSVGGRDLRFAGGLSLIRVLLVFSLSLSARPPPVHSQWSCKCFQTALLLFVNDSCKPRGMSYTQKNRNFYLVVISFGLTFISCVFVVTARIRLVNRDVIQSSGW